MVKLEWIGLDELKTALRNLPAELTDEASDIVIHAAQAAKDEIASAYPVRTGNLRDGLYLETYDQGQFGAGVELGNRAPHAHLFEYGTETRQTAIGADRGRMPAGNVFWPPVIRHKGAMYDNLKAMMVEHGLEVSGEAA